MKTFKSKDGQRPCLVDASIKKHRKIKYAIYIVGWRSKRPVGRGKASSVGITSLQRQHLLWGVWRKNKNRSRPLQPIVNSKHSSFSCQKICFALTVQSTSSVHTEVTFPDCERRHFVIMFFMFNIYKWIYHYKKGSPADLYWCQYSDVLLMLFITFNIL